MLPFAKPYLETIAVVMPLVLFARLYLLAHTLFIVAHRLATIRRRH